MTLCASAKFIAVVRLTLAHTTDLQIPIPTSKHNTFAYRAYQSGIQSSLPTLVRQSMVEPVGAKTLLQALGNPQS